MAGVLLRSNTLVLQEASEGGPWGVMDAQELKERVDLFNAFRCIEQSVGPDRDAKVMARSELRHRIFAEEWWAECQRRMQWEREGRKH
jgi:hypothetical protein